MSIGSFTDPIVVDPDPSLLAALAAAYRDAAPEAVNPDLDALRDAARGDEAPLSPAADLPAHGAGEITSSTRSPTRFIRLASSRRSRRRASGTCGRSQRRSRTPSSRGGPTVAWSSRRRAGATATARPSPHRSRTVVPDQRRSDAPRPLRRSLVADAEAVRIRTPSRHRLYGALRDRCGSEVADETVRLLDAGNDPRRPRRASGRTPPVRAAPPSIATCGAPARTPGSGARRRSPDKTRPRRGRSPRDGVGVAAGGTPSPATRRTGCAGGRVVAGGGSRGASEKGL